MNVNQDNSRRRIADMKMLQESTQADTVVRLLSRQFQKNEDLDKQKALNACIEALNKDIKDKVFDLSGFYKILNDNSTFFCENEQISFIQEAESIIRGAIKIEIVKSNERVYQAETEYIAEQGYVLNERYIISLPNNPEVQSEEWVVTEFRVSEKGRINPVHGCKIKKDGSPYAKAQYISLDSRKEFIITKKQ